MFSRNEAEGAALNSQVRVLGFGFGCLGPRGFQGFSVGLSIALPGFYEELPERGGIRVNVPKRVLRWALNPQPSTLNPKL